MSLLLLADVVLALLLIGLAWRILSLGDLFQAGVLFIVFGLVMAVAWLRLRAPDIALAEAAIGAGVTGALFLNTLSADPAGAQDSGPATARWPNWLAALLAMLLGALMVSVVAWHLATPRPPAPGLGDTGKLANSVTAVLLDVRAYDTLLETAVLVEALVGVWILARTGMRRDAATLPVLQGMVRVLVPVMVAVAGAVLWSGTTGTGGAFQSAAILAAAGILLRLGGFTVPGLAHWRVPAGLAALGTVYFLGVGLVVMAGPGTFLDYPSGGQKALVTSIEAAAAVSIAVVLLMLFEATAPQQTGSDTEDAL